MAISICSPMLLIGLFTALWIVIDAKILQSHSPKWKFTSRGGSSPCQTSLTVGTVFLSSQWDATWQRSFVQERNRTTTTTTATGDQHNDVVVHASTQFSPANALEVLTIVSNVLILMIDPSCRIADNPWLSSIVEGAKRRKNGGFSKVAIILLWIGPEETSSSMTKKESLINQLVHELNPDIVSSFDVATETTFQTVYRDVVAELYQDEMITNPEEYRLLFSEISKSLGLNNMEITFNMLNQTLWDAIELPEPNSQITEETVTMKEYEETPTSQEGDNLDENVLVEVMKDLQDLESQQEDVWLHSDTMVPMLQFGSTATAILTKASQAMGDSPTMLQSQSFQMVIDKLRDLYHNQLNLLREHYGRKYESMLEELPPDDSTKHADVAARITESFRTAAIHAIPQQCQEGRNLFNADFSYLSTLNGLLTDMMEATTLRSMDDDNDDTIEDEDASDKPIKWYTKLAARALMVGINYFQGWLAWQGIKRAADRRDRDMPKFPLF
jgi:hypothetical protein